MLPSMLDIPRWTHFTRTYQEVLRTEDQIPVFPSITQVVGLCMRADLALSLIGWQVRIG